MSEKKTQIRGLIILAIAAVVYTVAVFVIPFPKTGAVFWLSYPFTLAACGAQIYVIRTAFFKGQGAKSKFYGFPIVRIGVIYLLAQFVLGLIFMALAVFLSVPVWLPVVLYIVLLGIVAMGFIAADEMRDEVERQDAVLNKNVACMRALQSKTASLVQLAQGAQIHKALEKFSENVQFSDPVSSESLADIETDLMTCVDELHQAVTDGDYENTLALVQKAETILVERNRLCKLDKRFAH